MYDDADDENAKYDPQTADLESLLSDSTHIRTSEPHNRTVSYLGLTLIVLIISSFTGLLGAWIGNNWLRNNDTVCIRHITEHSPPVLEDVDISFDTVHFNGSLLKSNVYRQSAGPEVDAAWEALGVDYRALAVPSQLAEKAGLKSDQVKIAEKYGGGFPANVEGLHHLHCLNLLRKSLYYNYDYYHAMGKGAFKNDDTIVQYHVSHCLDILRQQLMCTVDIGVLGQVWLYPESPEAYVDFNTMHKCRNFDAIRRWAEERQLPDEVPDDFLQPPQNGDTVYETIP